MHDSITQPVLRCGQCNKPFDKESTLKRHGYYCRSRRATATAPRSRSCIACAKGKVRCDNKRPDCSRCTTKAIDCRYPAYKPKSTASKPQHDSNTSVESQSATLSTATGSSSAEPHLSVNNDGNVTLDDAPVVPDIVFADLEAEFPDWDDPDLDFANFLNDQTDDESVQWPSSGSLSLVRHSRSSTADQTLQLLHQAISSPAVLLPSLPSYSRRSLIHRQKVQNGPHRVASLLLHTLKSYPLMMLRHNTLPPFIHPSLLSLNADDNHMEPLSNCISLVHMISSGVQGSRKLFWKNVQLECERLCEEHLKLNRWELLAAMQALSIYVLIRLDEGETDQNNFDFLLIVTVAAIARQLAYIDTTCNEDSALSESGLNTSWKEWIFQESRRRLAVVYRVVNMLVHFEPAAMCTLQTDLVLAPLPARKQLWEAPHESAWNAERAQKPGPDTTFGLAATGELVTLDDGQLYCSDRTLLYRSLDPATPSGTPANWEEWCAGMDGFGGLVMLAASLVG